MYDIAYLALGIAFIVALFSILASLVGARRGQPELLASARNGMYVVCGLVVLASIFLLYALLRSDFSIEYVASYTNRALPAIYKAAAFYGGQAGSLLFWTMWLGLSGAIAVAQNWKRHRALIPYVMAVILTTQAFFLALMVFVKSTNPFAPSPFVPADGNGLNPLLQNPGMVIHPPVQLLGYAGFTIPFAFAIAALATRRLGDEWVVSVRRWTLLAWLFLGIGNLAGAQWAYVELGWGGYWAWDPVENSGLMPWLVGTALLHSIMIQKRRGMLKVWNIMLVMLAFSLSMFGTFLTRSGVLSSVHSFGDSALGPFFLGFIGVTVAGSILLLASRWHDLRSEDEIESLVSRESAFLFNNLILVGATFAIFLGTIFPVLSEAVRGTKVAVGPPFFNEVNAPIFLALILLMGLCPLIGWHKASARGLLRNFLYPLVVAIVVAAVLVLLHITRWYAVFAFAVCAFVIATILLEWFRGTRARHRTRKENYVKAFFSLVWSNRPRYGGYIVHLAILLVAIGVLGSSAYKVEADGSLKPGQSMPVAGYTMTYEGMTTYPTQQRQVTVTTVSLYKGSNKLAVLSPSKVFDQNFQPVVDVAIRSTPLEDVYIIPVLPDDPTAIDAQGMANFKVYINPLVFWMWTGAVVLIIGAVIAFWPDRRQPAAAKSSAAPGEEKRR